MKTQEKSITRQDVREEIDSAIFDLMRKIFIFIAIIFLLYSAGKLIYDSGKINGNTEGFRECREIYKPQP